MDNIFDSDSKDCGFESRRPRQKIRPETLKNRGFGAFFILSGLFYHTGIGHPPYSAGCLDRFANDMLLLALLLSGATYIWDHI